MTQAALLIEVFVDLNEGICAMFDDLDTLDMKCFLA